MESDVSIFGVVLALVLGSAVAQERGMVELAGEDGATVILDGITLGLLPLKVAVQEGVQTFEVVSRTGLTTYVTREVAFEEGKTPALNLAGEGEAEKEKIRGKVNVFGEAGTVIWVDGKEAGTLPFLLELTEGTHTIKVRQPDGVEYEINKEITFDRKGVPFNLMLN